MAVKLDVCGVDSWPNKHQKTLAMSPVSQFFHETSTCESVDVCGEIFFLVKLMSLDQFFQRCQRCSTGWKEWWLFDGGSRMADHFATCEGRRRCLWKMAVSLTHWPKPPKISSIWQNRGDSIIHLERFKQCKSVVILRDFPWQQKWPL